MRSLHKTDDKQQPTLLDRKTHNRLSKNSTSRNKMHNSTFNKQNPWERNHNNLKDNSVSCEVRKRGLTNTQPLESELKYIKKRQEEHTGLSKEKNKAAIVSGQYSLVTCSSDFTFASGMLKDKKKKSFPQKDENTLKHSLDSRFYKKTLKHCEIESEDQKIISKKKADEMNLNNQNVSKDLYKNLDSSISPRQISELMTGSTNNIKLDYNRKFSAASKKKDPRKKFKDELGFNKFMKEEQSVDNESLTKRRSPKLNSSCKDHLINSNVSPSMSLEKNSKDLTLFQKLRLHLGENCVRTSQNEKNNQPIKRLFENKKKVVNQNSQKNNIKQLAKKEILVNNYGTKTPFSPNFTKKTLDAYDLGLTEDKLIIEVEENQPQKTNNKITSAIKSPEKISQGSTKNDIALSPIKKNVLANKNNTENSIKKNHFSEMAEEKKQIISKKTKKSSELKEFLKPEKSIKEYFSPRSGIKSLRINEVSPIKNQHSIHTKNSPLSLKFTFTPNNNKTQESSIEFLTKNIIRSSHDIKASNSKIMNSNKVIVSDLNQNSYKKKNNYTKEPIGPNNSDIHIAKSNTTLNLKKKTSNESIVINACKSPCNSDKNLINNKNPSFKKMLHESKSKKRSVNKILMYNNQYQDHISLLKDNMSPHNKTHGQINNNKTFKDASKFQNNLQEIIIGTDKPISVCINRAILSNKSIENLRKSINFSQIDSRNTPFSSKKEYENDFRPSEKDNIKDTDVWNNKKLSITSYKKQISPVKPQLVNNIISNKKIDALSSKGSEVYLEFPNSKNLNNFTLKSFDQNDILNADFEFNKASERKVTNIYSDELKSKIGNKVDSNVNFLSSDISPIKDNDFKENKTFKKNNNYNNEIFGNLRYIDQIPKNDDRQWDECGDFDYNDADEQIDLANSINHEEMIESLKQKLKNNLQDYNTQNANNLSHEVKSRNQDSKHQYTGIPGHFNLKSKVYNKDQDIVKFVEKLERMSNKSRDASLSMTRSVFGHVFPGKTKRNNLYITGKNIQSHQRFQKSVDVNSKASRGEFSNLKAEIFNQTNPYSSKDNIEDTNYQTTSNEMALYKSQGDTVKNNRDINFIPLKTQLEASIINTNDKKLDFLLSKHKYYHNAQLNIHSSMNFQNFKEKKSSSLESKKKMYKQYSRDNSGSANLRHSQNVNPAKDSVIFKTSKDISLITYEKDQKISKNHGSNENFQDKFYHQLSNYPKHVKTRSKNNIPKDSSDYTNFEIENFYLSESCTPYEKNLQYQNTNKSSSNNNRNLIMGKMLGAEKELDNIKQLSNSKYEKVSKLLSKNHDKITYKKPERTTSKNYHRKLQKVVSLDKNSVESAYAENKKFYDNNRKNVSINSQNILTKEKNGVWVKSKNFNTSKAVPNNLSQSNDKFAENQNLDKKINEKLNISLQRRVYSVENINEQESSHRKPTNSNIPGMNVSNYKTDRCFKGDTGFFSSKKTKSGNLMNLARKQSNTECKGTLDSAKSISEKKSQNKYNSSIKEKNVMENNSKLKKVLYQNKNDQKNREDLKNSKHKNLQYFSETSDNRKYLGKKTNNVFIENKQVLKTFQSENLDFNEQISENTIEIQKVDENEKQFSNHGNLACNKSSKKLVKKLTNSDKKSAYLKKKTKSITNELTTGSNFNNFDSQIIFEKSNSLSNRLTLNDYFVKPPNVNFTATNKSSPNCNQTEALCAKLKNYSQKGQFKLEDKYSKDWNFNKNKKESIFKNQQLKLQKDQKPILSPKNKKTTNSKKQNDINKHLTFRTNDLIFTRNEENVMHSKTLNSLSSSRNNCNKNDSVNKIHYFLGKQLKNEISKSVKTEAVYKKSKNFIKENYLRIKNHSVESQTNNDLSNLIDTRLQGKNAMGEKMRNYLANFKYPQSNHFLMQSAYINKSLGLTDGSNSEKNHAMFRSFINSQAECFTLSQRDAENQHFNKKISINDENKNTKNLRLFTKSNNTLNCKSNLNKRNVITSQNAIYSPKNYTDSRFLNKDDHKISLVNNQFTEQYQNFPSNYIEPINTRNIISNKKSSEKKDKLLSSNIKYQKKNQNDDENCKNNKNLHQEYYKSTNEVVNGQINQQNIFFNEKSLRIKHSINDLIEDNINTDVQDLINIENCCYTNDKKSSMAENYELKSDLEMLDYHADLQAGYNINYKFDKQDDRNSIAKSEAKEIDKNCNESFDINTEQDRWFKIIESTNKKSQHNSKIKQNSLLKPSSSAKNLFIQSSIKTKKRNLNKIHDEKFSNSLESMRELIVHSSKSIDTNSKNCKSLFKNFENVYYNSEEKGQEIYEKELINIKDISKTETISIQVMKSDVLNKDLSISKGFGSIIQPQECCNKFSENPKEGSIKFEITVYKNINSQKISKKNFEQVKCCRLYPDLTILSIKRSKNNKINHKLLSEDYEINRHIPVAMTDRWHIMEENCLLSENNSNNHGFYQQKLYCQRQKKVFFTKNRKKAMVKEVCDIYNCDVKNLTETLQNNLNTDYEKFSKLQTEKQLSRLNTNRPQKLSGFSPKHQIMRHGSDSFFFPMGEFFPDGDKKMLGQKPSCVSLLSLKINEPNLSFMTPCKDNYNADNDKFGSISPIQKDSRNLNFSEMISPGNIIMMQEISPMPHQKNDILESEKRSNHLAIDKESNDLRKNKKQKHQKKSSFGKHEKNLYIDQYMDNISQEASNNNSTSELYKENKNNNKKKSYHDCYYENSEYKFPSKQEKKEFGLLIKSQVDFDETYNDDQHENNHKDSMDSKKKFIASYFQYKSKNYDYQKINNIIHSINKNDQKKKSSNNLKQSNVDFKTEDIISFDDTIKKLRTSESPSTNQFTHEEIESPVGTYNKNIEILANLHLKKSSNFEIKENLFDSHKNPSYDDTKKSSGHIRKDRRSRYEETNKELETINNKANGQYYNEENVKRS